MSAVNGLVGTGFYPQDPAEPSVQTVDVVDNPALDADESVAWMVALIVLGALGMLILFRLAGFQAVVAASAKLGG